MNGHPIGTRVRIVQNATGTARGRAATVVSMPARYRSSVDGKWRVGQDVCIDGFGPVDNYGRAFAFPPDWLEPIRDDWDTDATPNAVASWAGGVWAPHREVARG